MTALIPFTVAPSQFITQLDNQPCIVQTRWNVSAQRNYINVYDATNTLVLSIPLIASPDSYDINLLKGYFTTSTLVFRASTQQFEVGP